MQKTLRRIVALPDTLRRINWLLYFPGYLFRARYCLAFARFPQTAISHHRRDRFFDWSRNFPLQSGAAHVLIRAAGKSFSSDKEAAVTRRPGISRAEISGLIVNSILLRLTMTCSEMANRRRQSSITERSEGRAGLRCSRASMRPRKAKRSSFTEARTRSAAGGELLA